MVKPCCSLTTTLKCIRCEICSWGQKEEAKQKSQGCMIVWNERENLFEKETKRERRWLLLAREIERNDCGWMRVREIWLVGLATGLLSYVQTNVCCFWTVSIRILSASFRIVFLFGRRGVSDRPDLTFIKRLNLVEAGISS